MNSESGDKRIGNFQHFEHPKNAEHYAADLFIKKDIITIYSPVLKKEIPKERIIYHCPRCEKVTTYPYSHGDAYQCCNCNLKWQTFGGSIYVWDSKINLKKNKKVDDKLEFVADLSKKTHTALKEEDYEFLTKINNILKEVKWQK